MIAFHVVPDAFTAGECAQLISIARAAPSQEAGLVRRTRDHNIRRAELVWLDEVEGTDWVMDRLIDVVREANRDLFDFDLRDFSESPQIARYGADRVGHFDWHSDIGEGTLASRRKLTMVAQLSEGDAYEGGALEVQQGSLPESAPRAPGAVVLFPSFSLHRVTPVTSGERFSLTVWAHGPAFR